jgi:hypothetical protein
MKDTSPIDEPAPTIVGPQPGGRQGGRQIEIPRGMEKLVALAGLSEEWSRKVLADPLAAAAEGKIELSDSERAIVGSIPREAFARMIEGFSRSGAVGSSPIAKVAAGTAAAALLVTGISYAGESPGAKGGARADVPQPNPRVGMPAPTGSRPDVPNEAPKVLWMTDLEAAVAQAKKAKRAVMAVFLHPNPPTPRPIAGLSRKVAEETAIVFSQDLLKREAKSFRKAVKNSNVLAVRVIKPSAPGFMAAARELTPKEKKQIRTYHRKLAAYNAALKKYAIAEKLPAVVFIAPDGSQLSKLERPAAEKKLTAAVEAVPPLLAKWIIRTRKKQKRIYKIAPGIPPRDPKIYSPGGK